MEKGFIQEVVDRATEILTDVIATLIEVIGVFGEPVSNKKQMEAYLQLKSLPPQEQYASLFYMYQTYGPEEVEKWIVEMEGRLLKSKTQTVLSFEEVL